MEYITLDKIIDNAIEIHVINKKTTLLILEYFRKPELYAIIQLIQDKSNMYTELSELFERKIYEEKNKQYIKIDGKKIYLKNIIL